MFQIALFWCAFPDCGGVAQINPYDSCDLAPCEVGHFLTAGEGVFYLISSSLTLLYHCYFHTSPWVINHPLTCIMEFGGCKVLIDKIVRYHPNHIHIKFPVIFLTSPHPSAINVSYSICLSVPTHSTWKVLTAWWKLHFCTLYPYTC